MNPKPQMAVARDNRRILINMNLSISQHCFKIQAITSQSPIKTVGQE